MTLLCSFPNSWDILLMAIGNTRKRSVLDEVVVVLLSKEMRKKVPEFAKETLPICRRSKEKGKKREKGRSKSCGRSKSPRKSNAIYWSYNRVKHFNRYCKEEKKENKKKNNESNYEFEKSS